MPARESTPIKAPIKSPIKFNRRKRVASVKEKENAEMSLLNSMTEAIKSYDKNKDDEESVFAKSIAIKLRRITDKKTRVVVEKKIDDLIFEATLNDIGQNTANVLQNQQAESRRFDTNQPGTSRSDEQQNTNQASNHFFNFPMRGYSGYLDVLNDDHQPSSYTSM